MLNISCLRSSFGLYGSWTGKGWTTEIYLRGNGKSLWMEHRSHGHKQHSDFNMPFGSSSSHAKQRPRDILGFNRSYWLEYCPWCCGHRLDTALCRIIFFSFWKYIISLDSKQRTGIWRFAISTDQHDCHNSSAGIFCNGHGINYRRQNR